MHVDNIYSLRKFACLGMNAINKVRFSSPT